MSSYLQDLQKIYQNRFGSEDQKKKEELWKTLCQYFFQQYIPEHSTVMDIGAGFCEFINNIECQEKIALDINPDTIRYANRGVRVVNDDVINMESITGGSVDIAFASNFFEHLPDKVTFIKTLQEINRVLRQCGKLLILQPNIAVLHGAYWDFIDHYIPLSHTSIVEALYLTDYLPVEVRARFLPYTTRSRLPVHPFLVRMYLKLPLAHYFLGKQAWIVGEKK